MPEKTPRYDALEARELWKFAEGREQGRLDAVDLLMEMSATAWKDRDDKEALRLRDLATSLSFGELPRPSAQRQDRSFWLLLSEGELSAVQARTVAETRAFLDASSRGEEGLKWSNDELAGLFRALLLMLRERCPDDEDGEIFGPMEVPDG